MKDDKTNITVNSPENPIPIEWLYGIVVQGKGKLYKDENGNPAWRALTDEDRKTLYGGDTFDDWGNPKTEEL